jgi:Holliday junction resolvasome RuvABC endonuclease subunit
VTVRRKSAASSTTRRPERILSLDVSSVAVGFAVFDRGKLIDYGKYQQRGKAHGERLMHFQRWLTATIDEFKPDQVVVEKPYAGPRRSVFGVLMLYIAMILAVHFRRFECELPDENRVPANLVKKILKMPKGANHEARKRMMVNEINRLYGLNLKFKSDDKTKKVSEDDIADGIAVGRAWLLRYRTDGYEEV